MYWSKKALSLTPYVSGEQPKNNFLKLNTNENAFNPPKGIKDALMVEVEKLRLYPQPNSDDLRTSIAAHYGVEESQIFCSNGSDEGLALCYLAFFDNEVATFDITYSFYSVWGQLFDVSLISIPLLDNFYPNVAAMKGHENVLIANPNAPTGIALTQYDLEQIISSTKGVCVVDEAYIDFGGVSAIEFIDKYPNLVVVHTMSKFNSLAGLRLGYCIGNKNLIQALYTVKDSFNSYPLDALAQAGGIFAIKNQSYFKENSKKIIATREYTTNSLTALGIYVLPSSANFIFARFNNAKEIFEKLREQNILVRYFNKPRIDDFLRITIGTQEQMEIFVKEITKICK